MIYFKTGSLASNRSLNLCSPPDENGAVRSLTAPAVPGPGVCTPRIPITWVPVGSASLDYVPDSQALGQFHVVDAARYIAVLVHFFKNRSIQQATVFEDSGCVGALGFRVARDAKSKLTFCAFGSDYIEGCCVRSLVESHELLNQLLLVLHGRRIGVHCKSHVRSRLCDRLTVTRLRNMASRGVLSCAV